MHKSKYPFSGLKHRFFRLISRFSAASKAFVDPTLINGKIHVTASDGRDYLHPLKEGSRFSSFFIVRDTPFKQNDLVSLPVSKRGRELYRLVNIWMEVDYNFQDRKPS